MASLYGVNATKRDVNVPSDKIPPGEVRGISRIAFDYYVAAGALSNGDVINFMKLPKGARIIKAEVVADDLGTTGTGKLGWAASSDGLEAADDDALIASLDFNTAAARTQMALEAAKFHEMLAEVQVQLTLTAATTAAGTIKCMVEFVET
jgi:hypothetical protein